MENIEYIIATDLDRAWLNFELDLPLEPGPNGEPNPFYVDRPGNPVADLEATLLSPFREPPKFFFSGHRGCGKSTELLRVASQPAICAKYWPVHFSIKDVADINSLDYRDVLLAIGGQMYHQYRQKGGRLPQQLLKELDSFRGRVEKDIVITPERMSEAEVEGKLDAFFAQAGLKVKLEPHTRVKVRQVIEQSVTELLDLLATMTTAIRNIEKVWPLILIDDLDKPDLASGRTIFYEHGQTMLQPAVPIVYTVSSPLFYSSEIRNLLGTPIFLPNVKLHAKRQDDAKSGEGYRTMRMFAHKRLQPDLIEIEALDAAIRASGGVFREMSRLMRSAILEARRAKPPRITCAAVERAEASLRAEFWRFLTQEDRQILRAIRQQNQYNEPDKVAPLLQSLAALEYSNGEPWCDVHPALLKLLDETYDHDCSPATPSA